MKANRILLVLLTAAVITGIVAACAPTAQQAPPAGTQAQAPVAAAGEPAAAPEQAAGRGVTLAIASETPSVAPARHTALIGRLKNYLTHNGLFRPDYENLEPVPDVVASWRALSDTLFEFTLHEGIMFHNGDEMTAYDVLASLEYVRTYPYGVSVHGSAASWDFVDRYTFTIDTGTPNAMLFFDLAHHGNFLMPRSLIEAGHDFTVDPVGSGPFMFEEWRLGDSLTFRIFEEYFDRKRAPILEYVTWRIIPEGASRTIALETGEVDFVVDVAFPDIPRLRANPDITVFERPGVTFSFFALNHDDPRFNVYVRRAVDMALDREAMVMASLDGFGIPTAVTTPMFPGATTEGTRSFDPEGARALLAEHGIDPATLSFDMLIFEEPQRRRAEVAQSNLADIGITTTITMMDFSTWLTVAGTPDFESAFGNFTGQGNMLNFMRSVMHIDAIDSQNRSRTYNRELTDLIDRAIATIDADERVAILEQASRVANEYVVYIPTNVNILFRAFNSSLIVPEIAANGAMPLNMAFWAE